MSHDTLSEAVRAAAARFDIPGVAVGVWADGQEAFACQGVTSIDNPLPVDPGTLFVLGSISKSFTATALMRLVASGQVELDAPVRRYVPELASLAAPYVHEPWRLPAAHRGQLSYPEPLTDMGR